MPTIAVINQKGGCGKTTTAINLAAFLSRQHRRTLIIDMDPQGHASLGLLPNMHGVSRTMYDLFSQMIAGREARLSDITRAVHQYLDLAPANVMLSAIPDSTVGVPDREHMLSRLVEEVAAEYDFVIIDCPPQVGFLTINALMACSDAIIPIDPGFFSLHGIGKLLETLEVLEHETGHHVTPRALITRFGGRTEFVKAVAAEIRSHLEGRHFATVIRESVKLAEASSHGVPISDYAARSAGFEDYQSLAREVLEMHPVAARLDVEAAGQARQANGETGHRSVRQRKLAGPRLTARGVVFALDAPAAHQVHLVGDFNGWSMEDGAMKAAGTKWRRVLKLEPGRYRYRYVVDGEWLSDPSNNNVEPAPYGGHNSVFVLDETRPES